MHLRTQTASLVALAPPPASAHTRCSIYPSGLPPAYHEYGKTYVPAKVLIDEYLQAQERSWEDELLTEQSESSPHDSAAGHLMGGDVVMTSGEGGKSRRRCEADDG